MRSRPSLTVEQTQLLRTPMHVPPSIVLPAVGPRGPILLEDYHLIEKLAQFDRERIPERVVHARGAVAKGFFEVGVGAKGGKV